MKEELSNLMIGVVSGVVSAILISFVVILYNKLLFPKIKEMLYKGVNLEGEWNGDIFTDKEIDENGTKKNVKVKSREVTLTITQSAYQISGDLIIKNIHIEKNVEISFYKYSGFIRDNFVVINYLPKSNKSVGLGSILLAVKSGGKNLIGNLNGTELNSMTLTHYEGINLKRV
jgi:hypothetical protein